MERRRRLKRIEREAAEVDISTSKVRDITESCCETSNTVTEATECITDELEIEIRKKKRR